LVNPRDNRVQHILDARSTKNFVRCGTNPDYILTGLLRCALCGKTFSPASTRKGERTYRYYRCSTRDKGGRDQCKSAPLPAPAIEKFVVERLRESLTDDDLIKEVTDAVINKLQERRGVLLGERKSLPSKIAAIATKGKGLVEEASGLEGTARLLLNDKLQNVGDQLAQLEARLADVQRQLVLLDQNQLEVDWVNKCLRDFDRIWEVLTSENRGRLIRAIVSRIEVNEPNNDVRVFFANLDAASDEESNLEEVAV
jgi:site-specific DNA recombinase